MTCAPIDLVKGVSVSAALSSMDCQVEDAVQIGFGRLFAQGGVFSGVLTSLLTIYVALLAYGFMTGRTRLTLTMMSPRLMAMVLVLGFATVWPAYHTVFYDLFMGGPDEIASSLMGGHGSAIMDFAGRLDGLFDRFAHIAYALEPDKTTITPGSTTAAVNLGNRPVPVVLFWLSGLILLLSTLGVLILSRLILYLMLVLGPVFIALALFSQTRGLFNGWLRLSLAFALVPLLSVLGGTTALGLFLPLLNFIAEDPARAALQVQPMLILFMGSVLYAAFLALLVWVASNLVRDWQATWRDHSRTDMPPQNDLGPLPQASQAAQSSYIGGGVMDQRAQQLISSFDQSPQSRDLRVRTDGVAPDNTGRSQVNRSKGVGGLGQSYRHRAPTGSGLGTRFHETGTSGPVTDGGKA